VDKQVPPYDKGQAPGGGTSFLIKLLTTPVEKGSKKRKNKRIQVSTLGKGHLFGGGGAGSGVLAYSTRFREVRVRTVNACDRGSGITISESVGSEGGT